jgi:hypothetical protein
MIFFSLSLPLSLNLQKQPDLNSTASDEYSCAIPLCWPWLSMKQPLETEKYLFTKVLKLVQKLVLKSFDSTDEVSKR